MITAIKHTSILIPLVLAVAAPGLAQDGPVRQNQFSLDVGPLQGGLSYARRVGGGPFSIGGGVWGAWEPWNTFEGNVFQPMGVELFVRAQPSRAVHLELGPSVLRYLWADDCSECSGTFVGVRASAMVGRGIFAVGPTARFGMLAGGTAGDEIGLLWGIQARLLFSWGD